ncbi:MAG: SDR family NAD(P)-dependent oxidoreductase [Clostridia bacterium]|nr:SDR family NAD(P)-dependent oxidoreductase [Clostridia bacterium]MDR3645772.1 SDR family NAD(P)-dependent oxidoreductase [Clostridia bacterium]
MESMVFISGAVGGFGRAVAAECASRDYALFLTDLDGERLTVLAGALSRAYHVRVETAACDMARAESRSALFERLAAQECRFWMVINVAGMAYEGPFLERTRGEITNIVRVNVESTLDVTRALLDLRDRTKTCRIINVCSMAGFYPMPVMATYAATKRLLINISIALADELAACGVTVTALCPAGMPTNEDSCRAIEAQGFLGRITTQNVSSIAARTIDLALRGRRIFIPGKFNRFLHCAGTLVPPVVISKLVGSRWRSAQARRRASLTEVN